VTAVLRKSGAKEYGTSERVMEDGESGDFFIGILINFTYLRQPLRAATPHG